jgi:hypothetical protein
VGSGLSLELNDSIDDSLMPALLDLDGGVGHHLLEPADQGALLDGEFAAYTGQRRSGASDLRPDVF